MRPMQPAVNDRADGPEVFPQGGTLAIGRSLSVPPIRRVAEAGSARMQGTSERRAVRRRHRPRAPRAPGRHPGHALGAQQLSSEQLACQRRRGRSLQTYIVPYQRLLRTRARCGGLHHRVCPYGHGRQRSSRDVSCARCGGQRARLLLPEHAGAEGVGIEGQHSRFGCFANLRVSRVVLRRVLGLLVEGDGDDGLVIAADREGTWRLLDRRCGTGGGRSGGHRAIAVVVRERQRVRGVHVEVEDLRNGGEGRRKGRRNRGRGRR